MRSITAIIIFSLWSLPLFAQSVSLSSQPVESIYYTASVSGDSIRLDTGSKSLSLAPYAYSGEQDPSLKAWALQDGGVILRENIANFVFYDSFGNIRSSLSNSTGSSGGEAISGMAMDPAGKTVVVFNPEFKRDGKNGSRAKVVSSSFPDRSVDIFYNESRTLSAVNVSSDGELIALTSVSPGTDNLVHIVDRFGFNYQQISFDQEVKGVSFDQSNRYVTIYSGGRVAVYDLLTAERKGSTSIRNSIVQFAGFIPEDNTILALSASGTDELKDVEIHAINVQARKIARKELNASLQSIHVPYITRQGSGSYHFIGYTENIRVNTRF